MLLGLLRNPCSASIGMCVRLPLESLFTFDRNPCSASFGKCVQLRRNTQFIPKCRRKVLYGKLRVHLGEVFHQLAKQKESRIEEGHLMADHVHMMIAIPPKYAVSQVIGYIKGKSAIHVA